MNVIKRTAIVVSIIVTSLVLFFVLSGVFFIPRIEGKIIDKETGKPIHEAVIVVRRSIEYGLHYSHMGYLPLQETVSDENGMYKIPEIGFILIRGHLDNLSPNLYIFSPGYKLAMLHNVVKFDREGFRDGTEHRWVQHSVWDGKDIVLERHKGAQRQYVNHLLKFIRNILFEYDNKNRSSECSWIGLNVPIMLKHVEKELNRYNESIESEIKVILLNQEKKNCRDSEEFMEKFKL
jgi:hypothetical protein